MKFSILIAAIIAAAFATPNFSLTNAQATTGADSAGVVAMTPLEALEAAKATTPLPAGVTFTGTVEDLQLPASTTGRDTTTKTESVGGAPANPQESHEQWGGWGHGHGRGHGRGGHGFRGWGHGYGGWGHAGFGGFGHHRFGFTCGGIGGWAYPLDYWNSFGAGLYGGVGGCGLGLSAGGLFYC